jgi:hypothetical protein
VLHLVKSGGAEHEYEDAGHSDVHGDASEGAFDGELLRVAVADGASEAMLAGRWASALTRTFVQAALDADLTHVVGVAAADWDEVVAEYLRDRARRV